MGGLGYGDDTPTPRWFKWVIAAAVLAIILISATGCTERTQYGECWGFAEDQDPNLTYSIDVGNVVIGAVFAETFIVPAWTVMDMVKCPTGRK